MFVGVPLHLQGLNQDYWPYSQFLILAMALINYFEDTTQDLSRGILERRMLSQDPQPQYSKCYLSTTTTTTP